MNEATRRILPPWMQRVKSGLKRNGKNTSSKWIQLATISKTNKPKVRTVVFRGWNEINQLKIFSDSRSEKISDIENCKDVEICWIFKSAKTQFRFIGEADFASEIISKREWANLNTNSKSLWFWPNPSAKFSLNSEFPLSVKSNVEMPDNFLVILVKINCVEELNLSPLPHHRYRWRIENNWEVERINP